MNSTTWNVFPISVCMNNYLRYLFQFSMVEAKKTWNCLINLLIHQLNNVFLLLSVCSTTSAFVPKYFSFHVVGKSAFYMWGYVYISIRRLFHRVHLTADGLYRIIWMCQLMLFFMWALIKIFPSDNLSMWNLAVRLIPSVSFSRFFWLWE